MGFPASAPFIGAVTGNMLGGIISDRVLGGRRKPMMMLGALGTMTMAFLLIDAPDSVAYLGAALMLAGLMPGIGFAGYSAYPTGLATKATYPTAFGIVNSVGRSAAHAPRSQSAFCSTAIAGPPYSCIWWRPRCCACCCCSAWSSP